MREEYRRAWQSVVLLVVMSVVLGLGTNMFRSQPLPLGEPLPSLFPGDIGLSEANLLLQTGRARFWDVRSEEAFQKAHVPEAHSLETPPTRGKIVVVYCSSRLCPKAQEAAVRLRADGYGDVRVMPDGIKGWHAAGYPLQGTNR